MFDLKKYINTDLGQNAQHLYDITKKYTDTIFVDLGVRYGISSEIMLIDSDKNNNSVVGIDVDFSLLSNDIESHNNYATILGDSSTIGKYWDNGEISGLFVDTFHIKEQVLCELYHWYPHVKEGGFIVFHDSNWPEGKHDVYDNITWDRVEVGIKDFFGVDAMNYEDDFIKMITYPESWGMTIVELKKKKDFISEYKKWENVFESRNKLIGIFWSEENKNDVLIDLKLYV